MFCTFAKKKPRPSSSMLMKRCSTTVIFASGAASSAKAAVIRSAEQSIRSIAIKRFMISSSTHIDASIIAQRAFCVNRRPLTNRAFCAMIHLCEVIRRSRASNGMRKVRAPQGRMPANGRWRRLQGECNRDIPPHFGAVRMERRGKSSPTAWRLVRAVNPIWCKMRMRTHAAARRVLGIA